MWATRLALPSPLFLSSPANHGNRKSLKLRSSLYEFPLASKIMVGNLPYSADEICLQEEFSKFGQIAEVKLAKDGSTKRSKGYAFIQYTSQDDAMLALENMDQQIFDGRLIFVEIAKMGKERFGSDPISSGPPKYAQSSIKPDSEEDCWY